MSIIDSLLIFQHFRANKIRVIGVNFDQGKRNLVRVSGKVRVIRVRVTGVLLYGMYG